jgi:hypothetical protein
VARDHRCRNLHPFESLDSHVAPFLKQSQINAKGWLDTLCVERYKVLISGQKAQPICDANA